MPGIEQARSWYPAADPVHGFDHVLRVYRLAETIAAAEGADLKIVCAAALLHDASGSAGQEDAGENANRFAHQQHSAAFAGQVLRVEGWDGARIAAVQHCILAHRFRDNTQPETVEAQVLFDADKLDAIGAVGVARAVAYAAQAGMPAYWPVSEQFLQTGQTIPGELHSAYHEFLFKLRKIEARLYTHSGRALAQARHRFMTDFFARLADEMGEAPPQLPGE